MFHLYVFDLVYGDSKYQDTPYLQALFMFFVDHCVKNNFVVGYDV
jgi:hypothetical protein